MAAMIAASSSRHVLIDRRRHSKAQEGALILDTRPWPPYGLPRGFLRMTNVGPSSSGQSTAQ